MGRLLVFLGTAALLLGGSALLNWWVDPFGSFWKPAAVEEASASRPQCLISHELIGGEYLPFKLDVFRRHSTRTFVTGSSRVLKIGSWPRERTFANLGMPVISPEIVLRELERLPGDSPPQTMYLGVEAFWFNPSFEGFDVEPGFEQKARYLLSRSAFEESVHVLRRASYVLLHRWRKERVGRTCVIGRSRPALAWRLDGSRVWSFELDPKTYHPVAEPFTTDLHVLRTGNYANWEEFSSRRVRTLERVLALARARGWHVVGFAPPDGMRYRRFFSSHPVIGPRWREFGRLMPKLFHRDGFAWLDLRDPASIPCSDSDFVDGGYHTNAACSMRIRARLDRAAQERVGRGRPSLTLVALGDSIPAAVPLECHCKAGYVTLYARALALATRKEVQVENLAVPGWNSSALRDSVMHDEVVRSEIAQAGAIVVTIGHNDTPWVRGGGSAQRLRRNLDAVLSQIRRLRRGRPTLLRVTNFYNDRPGKPEARRIVDRYARTICASSAQYRGECADVHRAFNGPGGRSLVRPLIAPDGTHPNSRGHRMIANLLVELGFGRSSARPARTPAVGSTPQRWQTGGNRCGRERRRAPPAGDPCP
jgi:lysophospholipase L1-like esterase